MNFVILLFLIAISYFLFFYQPQDVYRTERMAYDPANYKRDLNIMRTYAFPGGGLLFPWNYSTIGPDTNRRRFEIESNFF